MKHEVRTMCGELRVREAVHNEDGSVTESRTISGKAIAFDSISEILYNPEDGKFFREIIKPEACTQEFLDSQDIKLNMLHDRGGTIARSNKGKGNLKVEVREDGVWFEFEAPKCDLGERCLQLVREGVYTGCSFEFLEGDYEKSTVREDTQVVPLITHTRLRMVSALTVGMDPAYSATEVLAREADSMKEEDKPEDKTEEDKEEEERKCNAKKLSRSRALAAMQREIEILEIENKLKQV